MKRFSFAVSLLFLFVLTATTKADFWTGPIIVDHNNTDITALSSGSMSLAKAMLHIAYGHTSHGSQVTDGMTGLVDFANGGGKGLDLPTDFFAWNNGGAGGALDLHDYAMGGDVGYYPDWVTNTRNYLNNSAHSDVNVILWSWCGQVDDKYKAGTLESQYLTPMAQLEADYPDVNFVYMTGHVDHWDDANNKAANQMIRDYCIANDKILYDFADIESYDPDGTFYEFPNDNCDYYASASGAKLGNWATQWQATHTEGVDWYSCSSAHSQPLNANQKAYAAWALFSQIIAKMDPLETLAPGDANFDGRVDGSDVTILAGNWQADFTTSGEDWVTLWQKGDFNSDGRVDGSDVTILAGNWQNGGWGIQASTAVPEPSTVVLLLSVVGFWFFGRSKKRVLIDGLSSPVGTQASSQGF